jgi:hypothetical protein
MLAAVPLPEHGAAAGRLLTHLAGFLRILAIVVAGG